MPTTSLGGLSVDTWLASHAPVQSAPATIGDAGQDGPTAAGTPRVGRVGAWMTWLAGIALGVVIAAPGFSRGSNCPPPGEGATYCHLQHDVLRAVMTVVLVTAAVVIARRFVASLPGIVRRLRGEGLFPTPPSPTIYDDPLLLVACHARVAGRR